MNREEQKALIREVLEEMRKEGAALPRGLYAEAAARCDAYADGLLRKGQSYALHRVCAQAARGLYRDKHAIGGGRVPAQYIADQEAAEEYFAMFRDFADVFQKHYLDRKDKPCKTCD